MIQIKAGLEFKIEAELGEGALWDARLERLWWVDILKSRLHRFDPASKSNETFEIGSPVGTVVPEEGRDVVLAVKNGFASFDSESGKLEMLAAMEHENPTIRFNDGKCDPAGRFWAGTMALGGRAGAGNLFCLERDLSVTRKIKGVSISNGLGWNAAADTMYYIDSPSQRVLAFSYDNASGGISAPRTAVEIAASEGAPDGMCVDAEGLLWIAIWGAGKVARFNPADGGRLAEVKVEGANLTTSCAIGGAAQTTLYITTAREHLSPEDLKSQPHAGSLFSAEVGVKGQPANPFKRL
jgi:sugar lactone lactonase YvrE